KPHCNPNGSITSRHMIVIFNLVEFSRIKNRSSLKYFITDFEFNSMYYDWFAVKYRLLDFILKCFCLVSNLLQGFSCYIELEFIVCPFTTGFRRNYSINGGGIAD